MRELCACHWYLNVSEALGGVAAHGLNVYNMGRAAICLDRVCKVEQVLASCEVVFKLPPAMSEMTINDALTGSPRCRSSQSPKAPSWVSQRPSYAILVFVDAMKS